MAEMDFNFFCSDIHPDTMMHPPTHLTRPIQTCIQTTTT